MPQVYRRFSEFAQRPPSEPRRRSSLAPQPTDADDSIVLSDLVRTGEASRLRRRGAMRLDHGLGAASRASLSNNVPPLMSNASSTNLTANTRPIVVVPSRAPTPPWTTGEPSGEDEYTYGGGEWRDWNVEDVRAEGSGGGMQLEDMRRDSTHDDEGEFMLFCGGMETNPSEAFSTSSAPFEPSPFPVCSSADSSPPCAGTRMPRTNGCGALVHVSVVPERSRRVWIGKEEASEVVVGLDATYFERSVIAKMMKSACGCIREGIGCAVCGNTLGTRYLPCQAASEGFFSRGSASHEQRPSTPLHPAGPRYWDCRPSYPPQPSSSGSSHTRAPPKLYAYTFFADHVSPSRSYEFPPRTHGTSVPDAPYRSVSRPTSPAPPPTYYGYRLSSSPRPYPPYPGLPLPGLNSSSSTLVSSFAVPPTVTSTRAPAQSRAAQTQPQTPRLGLDMSDPGASSGAGDAPPVVPGEIGMGVELDPDGVVVDVDMAEPSSPDKTGTEAMLWPGR
ncbi:hypothetical protein B0H21DRAFT_95048 [Amylocystis lapponica]|nr:hypothetical protein B0H21DRAFT_95048 [Amylocystis lapponica]